MNTAYLLTGGNLGNRQQFLRDAAASIETNCGRVSRLSAIYETEAWGKTDQPSFLNQALELETGLQPDTLIKELLAIEEKLGRRRTEKYGSRTIDIDILLFNDDVIDIPCLCIPHPRMAERRFVLLPLSEIAADKIHPVYRVPIVRLLADCQDPLAVKKFSGQSVV